MLDSLKKKTYVNRVLRGAFALLFAGYLLRYLRVPQNSFLWMGTALLLYPCLAGKEKKEEGWPETALQGLFALALAVSLVLGYHIHSNFSLYSGTKEENYIVGYTRNDILAVVLLSLLLFRLLRILCRKLEELGERLPAAAKGPREGGRRWWLGAGICLFMAWLPYFLVHYPGFILGDSTESIAQALGAKPWNNHHPILYTGWVKLCLQAGMWIKDVTFGCAIYSLTQMVFLAAALGYQVSWLRRKGASDRVCAVVTVFYAFVPTFAQCSIAMWKDPVFSAALMLLTLWMIDFVDQKGEAARGKALFYGRFLIWGTILCFSRNNGIYILAFCAAILVCLLWLKKEKGYRKGLRSLLACCAGVVLAAGVVTGPVYAHFGVKGPAVEGLGLFLNQMARVAAYDGEMGEADREFLDRLLPLERYPEAYHPCVVDRLKWDADFDTEYLNTHTDAFVRTWISLFRKNPICYLESWELNTFGYWAVNFWELNFNRSNITSGDPEVILRTDVFGIRQQNLLENPYVDFTEIFGEMDAPLCLAYFTWLLLFMALLVILRRRWEWALALAPSAGLVLTLLAATPHAYWQRYGLAEYYLLPVYLLVLFRILKGKRKETVT